MSESYKIYASRDYVDERALPQGATEYQQLMTDGTGIVKWEDREFYKNGYLTLKLSPEFDPFVESSNGGYYKGGSYSADAAQIEMSRLIGGEIWKDGTMNPNYKKWVFYLDGVRYESPIRRFPAAWQNGNLFPDYITVHLYMQGQDVWFGFHYTDGKEHIFQFELAEPVINPIAPEYITGTELTESDNGKILGVVDGKIELLETNSNSYSLSTEPAIQTDDEVVQTEYIKLLTNNETEVSKLGPYVTDYGFSALKDQIWGIEQAATIAFQNEAEIKPIREIASEQDVSYFQTVTAPYLQGIGRTLYGDEFNGQDFTGLKTIRQIVGELTAADLGLSGAMKFQGVVTTLPTSSTAGSVVLMGNKEYVYDSNGNWVELGDEGSHALKTITITAGSGLTGGGTLEANRTIAHSNVITAGTAKGGSGSLTMGGTFTVPSITYDGNGHITSATTTTYTLPTVININNITQTTGDILILDCN